MFVSKKFLELHIHKVILLKNHTMESKMDGLHNPVNVLNTLLDCTLKNG